MKWGMIMSITSKIGGSAVAMGFAAVLFALPAFAQPQNSGTGCYSSPTSDTETSKYQGCAPNINQAIPSAGQQQAVQPSAENKAAEDAAKYQGCGSPDLSAKSPEELKQALAKSQGGEYKANDTDAAKYEGCQPNPPTK